MPPAARTHSHTLIDLAHLARGTVNESPSNLDEILTVSAHFFVLFFFPLSGVGSLCVSRVATRCLLLRSHFPTEPQFCRVAEEIVENFVVTPLADDRSSPSSAVLPDIVIVIGHPSQTPPATWSISTMTHWKPPDRLYPPGESWKPHSPFLFFVLIIGYITIVQIAYPTTPLFFFFRKAAGADKLSKLHPRLVLFWFWLFVFFHPKTTTTTSKQSESVTSGARNKWRAEHSLWDRRTIEVNSPLPLADRLRARAMGFQKSSGLNSRWHPRSQGLLAGARHEAWEWGWAPD